MACENVARDVFTGGEEVRMDPVVDRYFKMAERYYDAYDRYSAGVARGVPDLGECDEGVSRVAYSQYGVVPPVWVGCGGAGNAGVLASFATVRRVLGSGDGDVETSATIADTPVEGVDENGLGCEVAGVESSCQATSRGAVVARTGGLSVESGTVEPIRGKNWKKNQAKRQKARNKPVGSVPCAVENRVESESVSAVPEWRRKGAGIHNGAFSGCTDEVQRELRDTRAKMLVERNRAALVRAEIERRKLEANLSSRTYELQVEAERLKLDAAREKVIADKLAKLPAGYAETVASEGLTSCVPSLSDGSVSPNSSISVAEVHRMMKSIADLTVRVAELTAQNQEDYVKKQAVIVQKDEELRAMEKKLAISDMKNRTSFGGEWASSSYDDDY